MIDAVCGFMFSPDRSSVALIRKNRPEFQAGKLNGIGGKIEPHEHPLRAMVREFFEETGVRTEMYDWIRFIELDSPDWKVTFYKSFGDLSELQSMTDEKIEIINVKSLQQANTLRNLQWMIPLCLDDSKYVFPLQVREK